MKVDGVPVSMMRAVSDVFHPEFGKSCAKKHACLLAGEAALLKAFDRVKLILAVTLRIGIGRNAQLKAALAENGNSDAAPCPARKPSAGDCSVTTEVQAAFAMKNVP